MSRAKLVGTAALGLTVTLVAVYSSQLVALAFLAAGRSHGCNLQGTWPSFSAAKAQKTVEDSLQAKSRLLKEDPEAGLEFWETAAGAYWVPAGSSGAAFQDLSEQKREIYSPFGLGVRKGDVVLDCGANIGTYSKTALAAGASKVIAIEPVPQNIECLRRNLSAEIADGRVVLVEKGVWNKEDQLVLNVEPTNHAGASFVVKHGDKDRKMVLPLTTIDGIVESHALSRLDFIKMDIEGSERRALEGGRKSIAKYHPRMALSVYHLIDDPVVIPNLVQSFWSGYRQECGACLPGGGILIAQVYLYH